MRGARFFATNSDVICPMPGGGIPDAGATLAALERLTGRAPEVIAGKPSPLILQVTHERLGVPKARCLVVGDRLETDIRMGKESGALTAVVLTGVTRRDDIAATQYKPDLVLENVGALLHYLV